MVESRRYSEVFILETKRETKTGVKTYRIFVEVIHPTGGDTKMVVKVLENLGSGRNSPKELVFCDSRPETLDAIGELLREASTLK